MTQHAIVWLRRDLRLGDHPALQAALDARLSPLFVYIDDPAGEGDWPLGAASRAWLRRSLQALDGDLRKRGSALLLRAGDSLTELRKLCAESGAAKVLWNRRYEPAVRKRDSEIKQTLLEQGIDARSFNGSLLFEPWTVQTKQDGPYRVFTPYWRQLEARWDSLPQAEPAPSRLPAAPAFASLPLDDVVPAPRPGWDAGFFQASAPGEQAALQRCREFLTRVGKYKEGRDLPAEDNTSRLSVHLAFGEISPRQIIAVAHELGLSYPSCAAFYRELGWREFSYHLMYHFPHSCEQDLTEQLRAMIWLPAKPDVLAAWQNGRTGIPIIDAAMRELWQTGIMHNRCRMIVASLLTKNLGYYWRHGADWFWDTLIDADLANNTQGWQWTAGTGADAAPYFRVFNPVSQGQRFDPDGAYIRRWLPELKSLDKKAIHAPWECNTHLNGYPDKPIVDLKASREAALQRYQHARRETR
ncbi:cryptochrome/photolyase family protein [Pseudomarimonas arenosa]|uniref:Deoxyribodipyrimidine photo-lyase n=1 Tax=Pseudomarimonas arenosa TaxID=2774145 RepID=A0AAW3ZK07_9GAMM|nr:deoxyribodipyrimidine photo-lyase [Pseudomarimonas arenosa]MBD8525362.1 deoxyribodipyrimidine photo-lyase [Pseudomarimonas arenosa]